MVNELELIIRAKLHREGFKTDRFEARVNGELLATSRQPLYDAARVLLQRGVAPETLLGMRHEGADHIAILPHPIGELARWTIEETDRDGLARRRWRPFSGAREQLRGGPSPASEDGLDDILVRDDAEAILAA